MNNLRTTIFISTLRAVALSLALAISVAALAQSRTGQVLVQVRPDHADWTYKPGESVKFQIDVLQNGHPAPGVRASYKIGPEMLLPEYSTPAVNVYHVNLQNVGGDGRGVSRLYGILCEPKAEGKFPAVLSVPGAGVRPYRGMIALAEKGIITFQIGIHGLPVILNREVYDSLQRGALARYIFYNLDNRNRYYYRRVYLGCVRANDFLTGLAKWNGQDLAVTGGSQGGALSIVTAALDPRVKGLAAAYPALSDLTGYLHNRAGGWPHMFRATGADSHRTKEKIETSKYYDVVNFARRVKAPGIYTWGFNDKTCPPTSMYAAYNVIPGKKELLLAVEMGHATTPKQAERLRLWLEHFLKHTN